MGEHLQWLIPPILSVCYYAATMIVVTGANGFIGSALCGELNTQYPDTAILAVDHIPTSIHDLLAGKSNITLITPQALWSELDLNRTAISWVIHLGACSSTTEQDWDYLQENNVDYSIRLFEWCRDNAVPLVYASSAATYGDGSLGFSETTDPEVLEPLNLYGTSKVLVDRWALKQDQTPPQWYGLRFFNVFGPNEYYKAGMASMLYKAYYQILETKSLKLFKSYNAAYKDGEQVRDFVYIKDITRWIVEFMEKKPASGIYNLGFGTARSWLDAAKALFTALDLPPQIEFVDMPENIKQHYQYFTEADISKLLANNLSSPAWPLEEAVHDYVAHLKIQKVL